MRISVIGAGRVGSALAIELFNEGNKINAIVDSALNRARKIARICKCKNAINSLNQEIVENSDLIIVSIRDDELLKYITKISRLDFAGKVIIHTSGVLTSEIFSSLKIGKANAASFHPAQTFTKISLKNNNLLKNIYFGIEGGKRAIRILNGLIKSLNSRGIILNRNNKILYHLGCVVASNFLVANFYILKLFSKELGVSEKKLNEILKPLFLSTVKNLHHEGAIGSLTGPVLRGDINTIEKHIKLLHRKFPKFVEYYKIVSLVLAEVSGRQNSKVNYKKISEILKDA